MGAIAPGLHVIDTMLGGVPGITAAVLVSGPAPAVVDPGAQTSARAVRAALVAAGLGPDDLAWIVLTHVHLDHCGAAGALAAAFPRARVVVHTRGARHVAAPERLVAAAGAVYGELAPLFGGLDAVDEGRIVAAGDGLRVRIGPGRDLVVVEAPGHARHHVALLDEATGTLLAGDALGVRLAGAGLYPAIPPPEFDVDAATATLRRLAGIRPERLVLSHFGAVPDPAESLEEAERQQRTAAAAALSSWRGAPGDLDALAAAVARALPPDAALSTPGARARWLMLRWMPANADGLAVWAGRAAGAPDPAGAPAARHP